MLNVEYWIVHTTDCVNRVEWVIPFVPIFSCYVFDSHVCELITAKNNARATAYALNVCHEPWVNENGTQNVDRNFVFVLSYSTGCSWRQPIFSDRHATNVRYWEPKTNNNNGCKKGSKWDVWLNWCCFLIYPGSKPFCLNHFAKMRVSGSSLNCGRSQSHWNF